MRATWVALLLVLTPTLPKQTAREAAEAAKVEEETQLLRTPEVDSNGSLVSPGLPDVVVMVTTAGSMWASKAGNGPTNWETNMACQSSVKHALDSHPGQAFTVVCYPTASLYWHMNPQ